MRIQGISDIRDIDYCTLEANGKISMLTKENAKSAVAHPIIIDGVINESEIRLMEMTENELSEILGPRDLKKIFLMTLDDSYTINIIIKEEI